MLLSGFDPQDLQPGLRTTLLRAVDAQSVDCGVISKRVGFFIFYIESEAHAPYTITNARPSRVLAFYRELLSPHFHRDKRKRVGLGSEIVTFWKYQSVLFFRFTPLICII